MTVFERVGVFEGLGVLLLLTADLGRVLDARFAKEDVGLIVEGALA